MAARSSNDFDSPWKEALEHYFPSFLALCYPDIHAEIDWSRGYEFLDKELQRVVRDARQGRGHVDKLVKVWRHSGEEAWVLIHVEVQHEPEAVFPRRMFDYNVRLRSRYGKMVVSLAVLVDDRPKWRPDRFSEELWGCRVGLEFRPVKVLDFASRREELEASPAPFAVVILAQLDALETATSTDERSTRKFRLVRSLYERGFRREDILELFRLVDWLVTLPEDQEQGFRAAVTEYEEGRRMPYVTSFERIGIYKTLQQSLLRILRARFGGVPTGTAGIVESVTDVERLEYLQERAATVEDLAEFERELP